MKIMTENQDCYSEQQMVNFENVSFILPKQDLNSLHFDKFHEVYPKSVN